MSFPLLSEQRLRADNLGCDGAAGPRPPAGCESLPLIWVWQVLGAGPVWGLGGLPATCC